MRGGALGGLRFKLVAYDIWAILLKILLLALVSSTRQCEDEHSPGSLVRNIWTSVEAAARLLLSASRPERQRPSCLALQRHLQSAGHVPCSNM